MVWYKLIVVIPLPQLVQANCGNSITSLLMISLGVNMELCFGE